MSLKMSPPSLALPTPLAASWCSESRIQEKSSVEVGWFAWGFIFAVWRIIRGPPVSVGVERKDRANWHCSQSKMFSLIACNLPYKTERLQIPPAV